MICNHCIIVFDPVLHLMLYRPYGFCCLNISHLAVVTSADILCTPTTSPAIMYLSQSQHIKKTTPDYRGNAASNSWRLHGPVVQSTCTSTTNLPSTWLYAQILSQRGGISILHFIEELYFLANVQHVPAELEASLKPSTRFDAG